MVNAGRILIMPKGDWNNLTTYEMLDLVAYNGVAYLARQSNVGQNPSTDTSMTYWQPFGSASSIATPTTAGLVMPDDETIKIDATGKINVNIDGTTLKYDATHDYVYADVVTALSALTDVDISSASNGQSLVYNSTSGKWENANISANNVVYSNTTSGMSATNVQAAIDEVEGRVDIAEGNISTLQSDMTTAQGDIDNLEAGNVTTQFTVTVQNWTSDTTSQSGTTLYKKQIPVTHIYADCPTVDIGQPLTVTLPTTGNQGAYNLLQYVTVDDTVPCLYLYSSEIPTNAYYIKVTGVD